MRAGGRAGGLRRARRGPLVLAGPEPALSRAQIRARDGHGCGSAGTAGRRRNVLNGSICVSIDHSGEILGRVCVTAQSVLFFLQSVVRSNVKDRCIGVAGLVEASAIARAKTPFRPKLLNSIVPVQTLKGLLSDF